MYGWIRWRLVRTLILKECWRYQCNWGLLIVVAALLLLSLLIAVAGRMQALPGLAGRSVSDCIVLHPSDCPWADYLKKHPPTGDVRLTFQVLKRRATRPKLPVQAMAIQLVPPAAGATPLSHPDADWRADYYYLENFSVGVLPVRDWFADATRDFLQPKPAFFETTAITVTDIDRTEQMAIIIQALVAFAMYLIAFNLYVTSTGEEREKKVLLALLLTPVRPVELILAKAIFHTTASLATALAIVAMYDPTLLLNPLLYTTIAVGSLGYVAIGTVILSLVSRQTTINTVSMLYLIAIAIVTFLGQIFTLFDLLRHLLIEDYLYQQLYQILSRQTAWWVRLNQFMLWTLAIFWSAVALRLFAKRSRRIAFAR